MPLTDEWNLAVPMLLMDVYNCLEDFPAVEREAAAALEVPTFSEVVRQVVVPGARALAWFEAGRLAQAAARREPLTRRRAGWGSASTSSPSITCACWPGWRWSSVTWTPPSG